MFFHYYFTISTRKIMVSTKIFQMQNREAESSKTYSQNSKNAASIIVESVLIYIWPSKSLYVSKNQA